MNQRTLHGLTPTLIAILAIVALTPASAATPGTGKTTRFLSGPQSGDAYAIVQSYLASHLGALGLTQADLDDMVISDRYTTQHNGVTHIYLQQRLNGIEVYNGVINVNVASDGSIISLHSNFVGRLATRVNTGPTLSDATAIHRAAVHVGLNPTRGRLVRLRTEGGLDQRATFSDPTISSDDIPARLVYQPLGDGSVRLAWQTVLKLPDQPDWWSVRVDAETGEVLSQYNWVAHDAYRVIQFPPYSDPQDAAASGPNGQATLTDPADASASPFGWHDTDGVSGADSELTRGNNVNAQDDIDANDSGGLSPAGGPSLDFDHAFDPGLAPDAGANLAAAIVNLFYVTNVMHDISYQYGFDEVAGNFQLNNYGNGGVGGDPVEADALDGSGTNNANFATPPDGSPPRMQMFRWLKIENANVVVDTPAGIAGDYVAASGGWGGALPSPTANVELVSDATAMASQGCNALIDFTVGNIALADRGDCEFGLKALNAENAGASGIIVVNNQDLPNGIFSMGIGADGGSVSIPAVMIGSADGDTLKGAASTLSATLEASSTADRDSAFDNGIIAHEYGHGISSRLTGGPGNSECLGGSEQAGEGWSDFWTLVLTATASDTPERPRGIANYVLFEDANGPGLRNFPYSTDRQINPETYADIATTNIPHGVGSVWMAMVWDMYWELVASHGFDEDLYNGTGGNNLSIQLVVDGMKMQPCNPTFVDARDAILSADLVNNSGVNECQIWRAFARRGLGQNAIAGSTEVGDEVEDFTVPAQCPLPAPIFEDGFETGAIRRSSGPLNR